MSGNKSLQGKGSMKRWLWLLLACLLVTAVLGGLKYLQISKAIAFANSFPERSEAVTAVVVQPSTLQQTYRTIGEVRATQYVELRNEVDGKISAINFTGGNTVAEGQVLLELDSSEERAQLRATRAQLKLAQLQLQRSVGLYKKKLISENDVDIARANTEVLLANVAALVAAIEKKTLIAPFAAETGMHNLQVGQYLAENSVITDLSGSVGQYWVDFELPQDKASLSLGDALSITGRGLIDGALVAHIVGTESTIDTVSRSRGYRALIVDAPQRLRPGAVINIEVMVGVLDGIFRLPTSAVRRSNFGAFVYVLEKAEPGADAKHRAVRKRVVLSGAKGDEVFVSSGLQTGEQVAAIGAFKLEDGLLVNIVERARDSDVEQGLKE